MFRTPMRLVLGMLTFAGSLFLGNAQEVAFAQDGSDTETGTETAETTGTEENTETPEASEVTETGTETAETSEAAGETRAVVHESDAPAEPAIMTEALLDKQLREVSTNVDTLKEDTFTTKSRLLLLREEVLQRSVGGARLQLRHKYDMGGQYEPVQVLYAVDQEVVYARQDTSGALADLDDEVFFDRMVAPGPHQLTVLYVYKGRPWGVFRYMTDYTFRVESGYEFTVDEGKAAELVVTAMERGNFFTAYEKRPSVRYDYHQYELTPQTAEMSDAE